MATKTKPNTAPVFTYTIEGKDVELPAIKSLPFGVMRKIRKLEEVDQVFTMLEMVVDEDTMAVLDELPAVAVLEMVQAWQEEGNAGESVQS
ncbi:hypothetical protein G7Y31_06645 [Corynebacterium lizhenjunii]|uniref:Phage tail assembly protein n=1 Tax=Corynebacterium lizhenjunii TaxID=2709394 RepID=A0A7T0KCI7_9CORY|nr:hypothetical protein [Corynebacterium lizhenjunii]QPK78263.1 hypothetical protein G7Y31_06645 [Corynebacterium lizhenjunii]